MATIRNRTRVCLLSGMAHMSTWLRLSSRVERLDQAPDVTVAECKGLQGVGIGFSQGHMIGHHHVGIANLLVDPKRLHEIDIAFVGEDLHKVVAMSANVAEVHVEDLLSRAEVADDVKDFNARIVNSFRDRSLTEIEPVPGTFLNGDESLEAVDSS